MISHQAKRILLSSQYSAHIMTLNPVIVIHFHFYPLLPLQTPTSYQANRCLHTHCTRQLCHINFKICYTVGFFVNFILCRKESAKNGTPKMALFTHLNQTFGLKSVKPSYTNVSAELCPSFWLIPFFWP